MKRGNKSWNGFQREAYDSIHRDLKKILKSRATPWGVEELSRLPLGSEKLRSIRGDKRSRPAIYKHLRDFEEKGQIRQVERGKFAWVWETEEDLPKEKIRELPEIEELKKACQRGDFLYSFNKRMYSEPEKDVLVLALRGSLPPKEKRRPDIYGREIGCMYVHTDLEDRVRTHSFVKTWRERFLYEEPYFLPDMLEWLLDNRGKIADLGIDIEFFTGKKALLELPVSKIDDLKRALLGSSKILQVVFSVNFDALFKWLTSPAGRDQITRILGTPRLRKKAEEISSHWVAGDKFVARLRRD